MMRWVCWLIGHDERRLDCPNARGAVIKYCMRCKRRKVLS